MGARRPLRLAVGVVAATVLWATALWATVLWTPAAMASPPARAPRLVFEAHVGPRTPELGALLDQLTSALETHGFLAKRESLAKLLGGRLPLPGITDAGTTAAQLGQEVTAGVKAYVMGDFDKAVAALTTVLERIHRNPGVLVTDTQNAEMLTRAYMALTLAYSRLGKATETNATMTELIRITRGQPISRADFGPEADKLYRTVLKQVQALGRGSLTITTGDDRAMIFVDGSLRGMGKAALGDLIPGRYRVFVQVPGTEGRRYQIEVYASEDHFLDVKAELEEQLRATDTWIGLQYASEDGRKQEARIASTLARLWAGEGMVAVIGGAELQGKPGIVGTLYRTDGSVVRSASIETAGADRERIRSLATFLADGTPDERLAILSDDVSHPPAGSAASVTIGARREASTSLLWPKLLVVGGIAMLGAGATLLVIDEDLNPVGPQQPTYRDTAPGGVALGAVGVVLTGVGLWWWLGSGRSEASAPSVSVTASSATLGWTAAF